VLSMKKKCIAMLLAGGQGSRLTVLTESTAKPAVPFGGKYRIVDFPLSNCVSSGIDTVGIMTQYQPLELNEYIGNGRPWGISSNFGGIHILPPYSSGEKSQWYTGTANAIYQNRFFVDRYNPDYVIVLSGDQIYKMDYSKMLEYHKEKDAECTIAVIDVPLSEASRFGIMNCRDSGEIYEFEEKPAKPKSTKASMGIYIFNWNILREYLEKDAMDPSSSNDFGKNVIPAMLNEKRKMFAYRFDGYWRDVGTIESLWEANMDLLSSGGGVGLEDPNHKIYSRNYAQPPAFIAKHGQIFNSLIAEGSSIEGTVKNSVISVGCVIEEGATVENSVIMPGAVVGKNSKVYYSVLGEKSVLGEGVVAGNPNQDKRDIFVVGKNQILF